MRYINTTNDNITFTDVDGRVVIVPKNRVYTHFKNDTITFLLVERYDKEGICLFTTLAEDLQINGVTYTYEQLLNGEGTGDMFSPTGLIIKLVDELPASGEQSTIYLIANDKGSFTEYLWLEETSKWEELGDVSKIDLSNYFTKSEINAMFANYYAQSEIDDMFDGYYTKTEVDDKLDLKANAAEVYTKTESDNKFLTEHQSLDNYYTKDNVYNKTESDAKYATQTVVNEEIAARIQRDSEIEQTLASKADKSDTYTKQEVDDAIANVDVSDQLVNYETIVNHNADKALLEASISLKANSADLATVATSGSYDDLSDKPTIPTVPTNVSAFTNDAGYLTEHQSLNDYYTKSEIDAALEGKEDAGDALTDIRSTSSTQISSFKGSIPSTTITFKTINNVGLVGNGNISVVETSELDNYYTKSEVDQAIPDTSDFLTKSEFDTKEEVVSKALTELHNSLDNHYTKSEVDKELADKQDKLTAGTNITIDANNVISSTGGEQVQADWNQTDDTAVDYIKNKPTNVSTFTNDAGYLTQHQSLADYYTKSEIDAMIGNINTILASI